MPISQAGVFAFCLDGRGDGCLYGYLHAPGDDGLRRVDHDGALALIDSAERAGVRHFVYTSYSGNIRVDSPLETAKRGCEKRLLSSKMRVTILRPSYFTEMWLGPALGFDPANRRARIYGAGRKVSYISFHDVVAFAVEVATNASHPSAILELGGPEGLSQLDAVGIFERTLRKKVELERVPHGALEQQHRSADPPRRPLPPS